MVYFFALAALLLCWIVFPWPVFSMYLVAVIGFGLFLHRKNLKLPIAQESELGCGIQVDGTGTQGTV